MKMRRACFFAVSALLAASASAQTGVYKPLPPSVETAGWHVYPEVGRIAIAHFCSGSSECEADEIAYGISAGWRFNDYFALDAGARYATGFAFITPVGGITPPGIRVGADLASMGMGVRGEYRLGSPSYVVPIEQFAFVAKTGAHYWTLRHDINAMPDEDAFDPYYGLGLRFYVTPKWSGQAEFTRYELGSTHADFFSVGATYRF